MADRAKVMAKMAPPVGKRAPKAVLRERELPPFSFFTDRSSAIAGVGGPVAPADPHYVLHTHYVPCKPGRANFEFELKEIYCEQAELHLRVLAFKQGSEPIQIGGRRVDLVGMTGDDLHEVIPFDAVEDIIYALHVMLTEPAPVRAEELRVVLKEYGNIASRRTARPAVVEAPSRPFGTSAKLFVTERPSVDLPSSQPFDVRQLDAIRQSGKWRDLTSGVADPIEAWKIFVTLNAVELAGVAGSAGQGLVLGMPQIIERSLKSAGATFDTLPGEGVYDYVVACTSGLSDNAVADELDHLIDCLAEGGWGMAVIPCESSRSEPSFRNLIQRLALTLLSQGHELYQMRIGPRAGWLPDGTGPGAFLLQFNHAHSPFAQKGKA